MWLGTHFCVCGEPRNFSMVHATRSEVRVSVVVLRISRYDSRSLYEALQDAFSKQRRFHRDITPGHIILYKVPGTPIRKGYLVDWDLSRVIGDEGYLQDFQVSVRGETLFIQSLAHWRMSIRAHGNSCQLVLVSTIGRTNRSGDTQYKTISSPCSMSSCTVQSCIFHTRQHLTGLGSS